HPQQRFARSHASRKPGDKTRRGRALPPLAKHLVDRRAREPALQHGVGLAMAERDAVVLMHDLRRFDALDLAAQNRKRAHACAHARRSFGVVAVALKNKNQRLAHLFMICSNIKLTGPGESIELRLNRIHTWNQRDSGMDVQRKLEILADAAKYDAS